MGYLRGFIYEENVYPPEQPRAAVVEFDDLSDIPEQLHFNGLRNHALIPNIPRNAESNRMYRRTQLPIVFFWC